MELQNKSRRKRIMSVNSISGTSQTEAYSYTSSIKNGSESAKTSESTAEQTGVVYEKSEGSVKSATYSINKMSESDRAALVQQLKADQESRQSQLVSIVQQMITKQAGTASAAGSSTDIWKFLADGNFTVDAATQKQAQEDISEDGYWGVKQTSQRLFDFASALAGDDEEKMKEMQEAVKKGYEQATKAWGKDLPSISSDTLDATNKLFEDYFNSKKSVEE
jgi:hypothetical protein